MRQLIVRSTSGKSEGALRSGGKKEAPPATTRAGFLRLLCPEETRDLKTGEQVVKWAQSAGLLIQGRPGDPVNRAEAATIIARHAGLADADLRGQVHWFTDVAPGAWYFHAAHVCRLYGIFVGGANNCFGPSEPVDAATALVLVARASAPRRRSIEEQRGAT